MDGIDPRLRSASTSSGPSASFVQSQSTPPTSFDHSLRLPLPQVTGQAVDLPSLNPSIHLHPYYGLQSNSNPDQRKRERDREHQHPVYHDPAATSSSHLSGLATVSQEDGILEVKRPRACESCRSLKVRCEPDMDAPEGPCKRCKKANRKCIVTIPSRKRQKKTDSRVAELEKKIEALTATIANGRMRASSMESSGEGHGSPSETSRSLHPSPKASQNLEQSGSASHMSVEPELPPLQFERIDRSQLAGQKRSHSDDDLDQSDEPEPTFIRTEYVTSQTTPPYLTKFSGDKLTTPSNWNMPNEYADVIDRKILDMDTATVMFNHYIRNMVPLMPTVLFPPGTTAAEIRRTRPVLFLAIMAVSANRINADLQRTLVKEINRVIADRVICNGEKSMEMVQAILVSILWYWPPDRYDELKFYQMIHIAAVMCIDLGLYRKDGTLPKLHLGLWRDRSTSSDPSSLDAKRAWLTCYFLAANASMALRRPNLIRWTSYMEDCLKILETSPDAYPSDKFLAQFVKLQRLADDVGNHFSMDEPSSYTGISDTKIPFAIKGFELQLKEWSESVGDMLKSPILSLSQHVTDLYMHEIAMHANHNMDYFRAPYPFPTAGQETKQGGSQKIKHLSTAEIDALTTSLTTAHSLFDIFIGLDPEFVRAMPTIHFVRIAYSVVLLSKLWYAVTSPDSDLSKIITVDNLKMDYYMGKLLEAFQRAAEGGRSRSAGKISMVLALMRTSFQRQREALPKSRGLGNLSATSSPHLPPILPLPTSSSLMRGLGPNGNSNIGPESRLRSSILRYLDLPSANNSVPSVTAATTGVTTTSQAHTASPEIPSMQHNGNQSDMNDPIRSTPLHLLSEIATGNSSNGHLKGSSDQQAQGATALGAPAGSNEPWYPPYGANPYMTDTSMGVDAATSLPPTSAVAAGDIPAPYDWTFWGFEQDQAFQQALTYSMTDGGLSTFFVDETMLGFMDTSAGAGAGMGTGAGVGVGVGAGNGTGGLTGEGNGGNESNNGMDAAGVQTQAVDPGLAS